MVCAGFQSEEKGCTCRSIRAGKRGWFKWGSQERGVFERVREVGKKRVNRRGRLNRRKREELDALRPRKKSVISPDR